MYVLAGLLNFDTSLKKCERYSLNFKEWWDDVPDLPFKIFSTTFICVDYTWIYGFGGVITDAY